jgi:hypothetical protein
MSRNSGGNEFHQTYVPNLPFISSPRTYNCHGSARLDSPVLFPMVGILLFISLFLTHPKKRGIRFGSLVLVCAWCVRGWWPVAAAVRVLCWCAVLLVCV